MSPRISHRNRIRKLHLQALEKRNLLAADVGHNFVEAEDVNLDGFVSARDALNVINQLAIVSNGGSEDPSEPARLQFMADVDDNGLISSGDALRIINQIARGDRSEAELEDGIRQLAASILANQLPINMSAEAAANWLVSLEQRFEVPAERRGPFNRLDVNQNAQLDSSEVAVDIWQQLISADTNDDNTISNDELKGNRPAEKSLRLPDPENAFVTLDSNRDGLLSIEELSESLWVHVAAADANGDQLTSLAELQEKRLTAEADLLSPTPQPAVQFLDANADQRIDAAELTPNTWPTVEAADTDSDGGVSTEELLSRRSQLENEVRLVEPSHAFDTLDVNADEQLTEQEISQPTWSHLARADADRNSAITLQELNLDRERTESFLLGIDPGAAFEILDINGDQQLSENELSITVRSNPLATDQNEDGVRTREELASAREQLELELQTPNPASSFSALDLNSDLALRVSEVRTPTWNQLRKTDANGDQEVTLEEMDAWRADTEARLQLPNPQEYFAALDLDDDEKIQITELSEAGWVLLGDVDQNLDQQITLEELDTRRMERETRLFRPEPASVFLLLDFDADASLSSGEVSAETWNSISSKDTNQDMRVSLSELNTARAKLETEVRSPTPADAFQRLDLNVDMRLTVDEISTDTWSLLQIADSNQDQEIEVTELLVYRDNLEQELRGPDPQEAFSSLDIDLDSVLTIDEMSIETWNLIANADQDGNGIGQQELRDFRLQQEAAVRGPVPQAAFAYLDIDSNQQLSSSELTSDSFNRLIEVDLDLDQFIALEELLSARQTYETQIRLPVFENALRWIDLNNDSAISTSEVTSATWFQLASADVNQDNQVTEAELVNERIAREHQVLRPAPDMAFQQLDVDFDGRLTASEVNDAVWASLALYDLDSDNTVTLSELITARNSDERQVRLPNAEPAFARLDAGGDGLLNVDEVNPDVWAQLVVADLNADGAVSLVELAEARARNEFDVRTPTPESAFAALDIDQNGRMTQEEVTAAAWEQLLPSDQNQDEAITLDELASTRQTNESNVVDPTNPSFLNSFHALDLDGDESLQASEVSPLTWLALESADSNADGFVTATEIVNEPEDITHLVRSVFETANVPALTGAIIDSNGIRAVGTSGVRVSGGNAAAENTDLWHLGSNTKAMTATLYATFVRDGLLSFDNTMAELFPNLNVHSGFANVTPRMLLAHRGGAPTTIFTQQWNDWWAGGDVKALRAEWAQVLLEGAPPETVGEYHYSNGGYVIVGAVMEAITGKSWEQLMQERLFDPLGMDRCGFGAPPDGNVVGHDASGTPRPGLDNPPTLGPAGTVHCDLQSWSKFVSANLQGAQGETSFLPTQLWSELHEPQGGYALGWGVSNQVWADGVALSHAGSNTMWYAIVWVAPQKDRAFVAITNTTAPNTTSVSDLTNDLIQDLIDHDLLGG